MKILKRLAWVLGMSSRGSPVLDGYDPADMGTAFGLDSITVLPDEEARKAYGAATRPMQELDRSLTY